MGRAAPAGRGSGLSGSAGLRIGYPAAPMSDQPIDTSDAPPVPPEVEQAAMLGNITDAVNLYVKHTGVDPEVARAVVDRLAE
jgi:hypothetical protein